MTVRDRDDRMLPLTRGVAAAIVPFLVVAFVVLYPFPGDTRRLFAWQIRPTLTPMLLGSAYLGGAYFFVRVAAARSWRSVKGGFVPVAAVGGLALLTGVFLFLVPDAAIASWPWTLTPLTARVIDAVFCLGLGGLGALLDRRWQSARILLQVAGVMLVLMLVAGVRAHAQLDPGNVLTWLLAAGFGAATVVLVTGYVRRERLAVRG